MPRESAVTRKLRRIYTYCMRRCWNDLPHEWKGEYHIAFCIVFKTAHPERDNFEPWTIDSEIERHERSKYGKKIATAKQHRYDYLAQAHIYPAGSFPPKKPMARGAAVGVVTPAQLKLFR